MFHPFCIGAKTKVLKEERHCPCCDLVSDTESEQKLPNDKPSESELGPPEGEAGEGSGAGLVEAGEESGAGFNGEAWQGSEAELVKAGEGSEDGREEELQDEKPEEAVANKVKWTAIVEEYPNLFEEEVGAAVRAKRGTPEQLAKRERFIRYVKKALNVSGRTDFESVQVMEKVSKMMEQYSITDVLINGKERDGRGGAFWVKFINVETEEEGFAPTTAVELGHAFTGPFDVSVSSQYVR